jgi:hypothetical protein
MRQTFETIGMIERNDVSPEFGSFPGKHLIPRCMSVRDLQPGRAFVDVLGVHTQRGAPHHDIKTGATRGMPKEGRCR